MSIDDRGCNREAEAAAAAVWWSTVVRRRDAPIVVRPRSHVGELLTGAR